MSAVNKIAIWFFIQSALALLFMALLVSCESANNAVVASPPAQATATVAGAVLIELSPDATLVAMELLSASDLFKRGQRAFQTGELELARAYLDRLITVEGNYAQAYYLRAQIYAALGILDLAYANFSQAMVIDPEFALAYYQRGLILLQVDSLQEALLDFTATITIDPAFADAYKQRAFIEATLGQLDAAKLDLTVYAALAPQADDIEQVEGWIDNIYDLAHPTAVPPEGAAFFDDFSNKNTGWIGGASAPGFGAYSSGGYRIIISHAESLIWARPTLWLRDVRIEVEAKMSGGPEDNVFGLLCRYRSSENFYAFIISSDGHYGIAHRIDAGPLQLIGLAEMPKSDVIRQGMQMNHIVAECIGDLLRLTVNGVLLFEIQDSALSAGDVGIIAGAFDEPRTDITFDNFVVFELIP